MKPKAPLVDLNAHVLPGLDDGIPSPEAALKRLHEAHADGVRVLCAVSSSAVSPKARVITAYERLLKAAREAGLELQIVSGHQAALRPDLAREFREGSILPLGNSGYVFVELPPDDFPSYTLDALYDLSLEGTRVLLIHPELNYGLQKNPALVKKLCEMEVVGVAAARHLRRKSSRVAMSSALSLIEAGLVQAVASYAGRTQDRPARLTDVAALLGRHFGDSAVESLLTKTPHAISAGLPVEMRPASRRPLASWFSPA